jgi:hypothetical protein
MPPAGFDLAIPASERPQTHALDRAATGIGTKKQVSDFYLIGLRYVSVTSYKPNYLNVHNVVFFRVQLFSFLGSVPVSHSEALYK